MHFLARFRILTKILAIVILLSISALGDLSEKADVMATAANRALLAARANQNVLALNRAEFRSALDPRDENRLTAREVIETELKQYQERFDAENLKAKIRDLADRLNARVEEKSKEARDQYQSTSR